MQCGKRGIMSVASIRGALPEQNKNLTRLEAWCSWIHERPTTVKVLKIAALILGIGLIASLPFTAPILGTGLLVGLAITGALLILTSSVALVALDLLVSSHNMKNHVYKPNQCESGKLYYEGDVPILSLDYDDPIKAGRAQGYLCGEVINRISKRLDLVLHTLGRKPRSSQLSNILSKVRATSPWFLSEIKGLVEGYNRWAREQHWWQFPKKLTEDDILLLQLIPDSLQFDPGAAESNLQIQPTPEWQRVACSAIVERNEKTGFVFARNMDWPSFGLLGACSLVIHRKNKGVRLETVEVGFPSFIGTLTGMNSNGLSLAMNVCPPTRDPAVDVRGMPAALYNRMCLEMWSTVDDLEVFSRIWSPLGPYHLTVSDKVKALSIHFYQDYSRNPPHFIRRYDDNQHLYTLNCYYNHPCNCGDKRPHQIDRFFQHRDNRPLEEALSLPFVNNLGTTHRVVMEPQTRRFRVAFDNSFAGKAPLQEVSASALFQNSKDSIDLAG
jgi:hypothetical protein